MFAYPFLVDDVIRKSCGVYEITPPKNDCDKLHLFIDLSYSEPKTLLFVLSRNRWHCQYEIHASAIERHRNDTRGAVRPFLYITTGLSGSLDKFEMRVFSRKSVIFGRGWRYKSHDFQILVRNLAPQNAPFSVDMKDSPNWYEASSFQERLKLRGHI